MRRLNRGQRIGVLAGLAFIFWVLGETLIQIIFDSGFIAYAPLNSNINWTFIWQSLVRLGIWLVLTSAWIIMAVRALRTESRELDDTTEP
jgi:hypothetical protein